MKLLCRKNSLDVVGGVRRTPPRCPDTNQPLNPPLCTIPDPKHRETQNIAYRLLFSSLGEFVLDP